MPIGSNVTARKVERLALNFAASPAASAPGANLSLRPTYGLRKDVPKGHTYAFSATYVDPHFASSSALSLAIAGPEK
jgi:hypothetical protein